MLAACNPSIVEWAVLATTAMVQDVCRLYPYVRDEMRTHICGSDSGVAAVAIAVDRETAEASRGLKMARETVTYTCVPYECNWSQDVVKCTLDLVLSSSTHTNAVQAIAVASKGCCFSYQSL